jgi:hypothetical protein
MQKDKTSLKHKQQFIKLCLLLFPEYRSGKMVNGKVVFWKKRFSLFQSKVTFSSFELLLKTIPLQLSYCIWNSNGLYTSVYVDTLKDIFDTNELNSDTITLYNEWFKSELERALITNISEPTVQQYNLQFTTEFEKKVNNKEVKVLKISVKTDIIDPAIIQLQHIRMKAFSRKFQTIAAAIIVSATLNLGIWFRNITLSINNSLTDTAYQNKVVAGSIHIPLLPQGIFYLNKEVILQYYHDSS